MTATPGTSCVRPDGKLCPHSEDEHGKPHPLWGNHYCYGCARDEHNPHGIPVGGAFIHNYAPHLLTEAGWLPL